MRDHVTEELISAYVDGELEGDELKLVDDLLTESAEHRQLLAEFQAMRASMWALPSFHLPADFHTRVVGQIDNLAVSPAKEPVRRTRRKSKALAWGNVFFAAASLAAMVAFTVMLNPATPDIPGIAAVGTTRVFPVLFQDTPQYVMIYDLTVTPAGQANNVVGKSLENLGIGIDPALHLSKKFEKNLMAIRQSPRVQGETEATTYSDDPTTPKSTAKDKVEMIYIKATMDVLDQFGWDLEAMRNVGKDVSQLHYDVAIEPNKLGVMHRLHDAAREHFADNRNIAPSDIGQAFRLSFRVELTSISVPGNAAFPIPTIQANDAAPPNDAGGLPNDAGGLPNNSGHILLIIRNVGAN